MFRFPDRRQAVVNSAEDELVAGIAELSRRLRLGGRADYVREVVPIDQWLDDPYYVGERARSVFPALKKMLAQACLPQFTEIILSGSIGYGKTHAACLIQQRLLYELSCMRDPAVGVGLAEGSELYIVFVSTSKEKAKETGYTRFARFIYSTPYFLENFCPDPTITGHLDFPKGIKVKPAVTNEHGILSYDLVGLVIDEAAFMRVTEKSKLARGADDTHDQAQELYDQAKVRMKSRLHAVGSTMKAKLVVSSSALFPDDFVNRRKLEAARNGEREVYVYEASLWEAKRGALDPRTGGPFYDYDNTFPVEVGDELRLSRILEPGELPRAGAQVVNFPMDFWDDCNRNLDRALRDIAGVPLLSLAPLITDRARVVAATRSESAEDCSGKHPFTPDTTCLIEEGAGIIGDYLCVKNEQGIYIPRIRPNHPRCIHIDVSAGRQDALGFAMSHAYEGPLVKSSFGDGSVASIYAYVDLMLRVIAPPEPGADISWAAIEDLIDQLTELGFPIALITMDSPMSPFLIQRLNDKGYFSEPLSVDRTTEQYIALRTCINEGRVTFYYYEPFIQELLRLEFNRARKKIDHPRRGAWASKDVADAVCGSVYSAVTRFAEFDPSANAVQVTVF